MKKKNKLKIIFIVSIIILVVEGLLFIIIHNYREYNVTYTEELKDLINVSDGFIGVGDSHFKNSDNIPMKTYHYKDSSNIEYDMIANQAWLVKYDNNFNVLWEKTFDSKYDSSFNSIIEVDDGYIIVGSYVKKEKQLDEHVTTGLITKYDKNGKMLWYKDYDVLTDTKYNKVISSGEDYIVIGQTIYANTEVGNAFHGGGIITRYSKDGELLAYNNYGGNKSGNFNDVIEVSDGYIVCGRDATNYGIIVKFTKDFNRELEDTNLISKKIIWNKTYSNTNELGFTDMSIINNKIYVSGAINVSTKIDVDKNPMFAYDFGYIIYDLKGTYLDKKTFGGSQTDIINSFVFDDNSLIMVGTSDSTDLDISNCSSNSYKDIILKYDLEGNITSKKCFYGERDDSLTKIFKFNDKYIVLEVSNSYNRYRNYESNIYILNDNLERK